MIEVAAKIEVHRAFLVGIASGSESDADVMDQLDELAELVRKPLIVKLPSSLFVTVAPLIDVVGNLEASNN